VALHLREPVTSELFRPGKLGPANIASSPANQLERLRCWRAHSQPQRPTVFARPQIDPNTLTVGDLRSLGRPLVSCRRSFAAGRRASRRAKKPINGRQVAGRLVQWQPVAAEGSFWPVCGQPADSVWPVCSAETADSLCTDCRQSLERRWTGWSAGRDKAAWEPAN